MSKLLVVLLFLVFVGHFTAEVFVEDKRLQTLINNAAGIGLILFFIIAILGSIFIGI